LGVGALVEDFQKFSLIIAEALERFAPADAIGAIVSSAVLSVVRPVDPGISSMMAAVCSSVDSLASRVEDVEEAGKGLAQRVARQEEPRLDYWESLFAEIQNPMMVDKVREALCSVDGCCLDILSVDLGVREIEMESPPSDCSEFMSQLDPDDSDGIDYGDDVVDFGERGHPEVHRVDHRFAPANWSFADGSSCTTSSPHGY